MAFIKEISNHITSKYNLSEDLLTIIFPNKRAALMLRKEFEKIDGNIWLPQILSIQEAMSMWSGMHLVENIDVVFELIKILNKNNFSSDSNVFGLASQMAKDFDEIDQYKVSAESIFTYLKDVKIIEKWNLDHTEDSIEKRYIDFFSSLYTYYKEIRETLEDNNCGYYGMITRKLSELDDKELIKAVGHSQIIFAGFNAMTSTEEDIIVKLVKSQKAEILWDLDKYYYNDEQQEAGFFAREFFKKHQDIECNFLHDNFNDKNKEKNINIIGVSGSAVQTNALLHKLHKKEESDKKQEENKEVVILSDETLLIPVLNSIPSCYDIQVTMGYPYSKTVLHQFMMQLFVFQNYINVKDEKIYFWALKKIFETELVKNIFSSYDLSQIDILLKESIYYIEINCLEKYFNGRMLKFVDLLKNKWSPTDCVKSIKSILNFIQEELPKEKGFVKKQIAIAEHICNKIERLSFKYQNLINISDIEMLYNQSANEMSIKLDRKEKNQRNQQGEKLKELQIMGLLETRNLDFDVIHILSVNEGILPQSKSANSLIPYDIRLHYKLPIYKNKQAVYAYHFYRLLQNAKTVNIYYNTLASRSGESEPSRFIRQIIHEMPNKSNNVNIVDTIYKNPDIKVDNATTFEVVKTEDIIDKIKKRFYGENEDGRKIGLSPTAISMYFKCPMMFYLNCIENVKEDTHEELIQSNEIGNIIHSFFEYLYEEFRNDNNDYKQINQKDFEEIVKSKYDEIYQKALTGNNFPNGLPNTGFNYLSKVLIKELIDNFIKYEKVFLKDKELKIIGLEKQLHHEFTTANGDKIYLTGFADRIDKVIENGKETIRIIDYKSGGVKDEDVRIQDKKTLSEIPEKSLQLLIYKYLYRKMNINSSFKVNNIEPAIYGLLRMDNVYFPLVNMNDTFKSESEDDDKTFIDNCDKLFKELIEEILDPTIKFKQTTKNDNCTFCSFKSICKRYPKKFNS